jgi:hypothetical protein
MHKEGKRDQKLGRSRRSEARARKQRTRGQRGGRVRGEIYGIDFLLDLVTSSLMRGILMGEISKLGWLLAVARGLRATEFFLSCIESQDLIY